jgi:hypothetical protein
MNTKLTTLLQSKPKSKAMNENLKNHVNIIQVTKPLDHTNKSPIKKQHQGSYLLRYNKQKQKKALFISANPKGLKSKHQFVLNGNTVESERIRVNINNVNVQKEQFKIQKSYLTKFLNKKTEKMQNNQEIMKSETRSRIRRAKRDKNQK